MSLSRWDEQITEIAFWRGLVEKLVDEGPIEFDRDDWGSHCHFCREEDSIHANDCPYILAKVALKQRGQSDFPQTP